MSQKIVSTKYSTASGFIISIAFVFSLTSNANDFASLQQKLIIQNDNLLALEDNFGRHDFQLVEPLTHLAQTQFDANHFDDAMETVSRALQITRLNHGLYTKEQYDLLAMKIDIDIRRASWDKADKSLRHFKWLVENRFEGNDLELLEALDWLANVHMQGVIHDKTDQRAYHLIAATRLNEQAVHQAQILANTNSRFYAELLYSLTEKYYLETRGILGGGSTAYYLRLLNPYSALVDSRSRALEVRYRVGLEKLTMLRAFLQDSMQFDSETVGMAELYIADWKVLFNKSNDINAEYAVSFNSLKDAGVSKEKLDQFFSQPAILPRPVLSLSIEEALAVRNSASLFQESELINPVNSASVQPSFNLSLYEPTQFLGGHAVDFSQLDLSETSIDDWQSIRVDFEFDPTEERRVRNGVYFTKSHVSANNLSLIGQPGVENDDLRQALAHIKTLSFRPAFFEGKALEGKVDLDFRIRVGDAYPLPSLVMR
ncbi:MAG: hypothetical protein GKR91_08120 [Pseudomonadales bacterium]|nr:hypothetical protein [Pseudomonadales bacterium]